MLAATAAGRVWAADERDTRAHLSWRGGSATSTAPGPATTSAGPPATRDHPAGDHPGRVNRNGRTSLPPQPISRGPAGTRPGPGRYRRNAYPSRRASIPSVAT